MGKICIYTWLAQMKITFLQTIVGIEKGLKTTIMPLIMMSHYVRIANEVLMYFRSMKKSAGDVSLSDTLETEGDDGSLCLMDVVSFEDDVLEQISKTELSGILRGLMSTCLDGREQEIVAYRYGLKGGDPLTQKETAQKCGISRSYVSRIEKKALEKLKKELLAMGM